MSSLRLALRQLRKSPGYTAITVLTLALGIGLNTSMFSLLNLLLLRPLPCPDAHRLVRLFGTTPEARNWALTAAAYQDLRDARPDLACFVWWGATLTEPGEPAEVLVSLRASPELLPTLGVQPMLGRWFTDEENAQGADVVLLSHRFWQRRFAGDPGVVGRVVRIDTRPFLVVGIMPAAMRAPLIFGEFDLIRPIAFTPAEWASRDERNVQVIARLRPAEGFARAEASLRTIAGRLEREHPEFYRQAGFRLMPLHASGVDETARRTTWLALGLAGFVLVIACANLANLQLVRSAGRLRETAICAALGASRWQLLRPLLGESLLLAVTGGGAGLLVALAANGWIGRHVVLDVVPLGYSIPIDARVLAFAGLAALVTTVLSGTVPAWWATRAQLGLALRDQARGSSGGRGHKRFRQTLVAAEFALALVLLSGAGLLLGGLRQAVHRDVGWQPVGLACGYVPTSTPAYRDPAQTVRFYEEARERLARLPGVEAVAFGWELPVTRFHSTRALVLEDRPADRGGQQPETYVNGVLPGYFNALQIRLLEGRDFTRRDGPSAPPVVIVNETLARTFWPRQSALHRRLATRSNGRTTWCEIVGVAADVRFPGSLGEPPTRFQIYLPFAQEPWQWGGFALRTSGAPASLLGAIQRVIATIDPDLPVWQPRTVEQWIGHSTANSKLIGQLLAAVALLGLFLAALGIYGVISHTVAQRTTEIGIRLALGAQLGTIHRLVLGGGLRPAIVGVVAGLAGSAVVVRLLATVLPAMPALNLAWLAAVAAVLVAAAVLACWLPARRATRIDPLAALRAE